MKKLEEYNGWKNKATWNVALWIGNDEPLYRAAVEFVRSAKKQKGVYYRFVKHTWLAGDKTPDGFKWDGSRLDYKALDEMMFELIAD